ncbi:amino acid ABC transporter ATP-binding protein [Psychrobacillus sp. NEAU-3TGS]|uniref:amino acid ABC transporter ATP-binding protein n=1 Tax=Psychrobacillus sp. NEAU-3TGS TaxID=2995412 RepID=UPI0024969E83|nr:amino acid ABC transporter ATP-binding protein [Psychrobacillus sp. NEAU-3TGS]MDI2588459.1 amino acid ABC transporter ATP-binding protein [Psychrobacillus sp. NEAU-3TGS]
MIQISDLSKSFDQQEVIKNISLTIPAHQVVAVIGPSGSGKSTFLRCINGLEKITGGAISVNNHQLFAKDSRKVQQKTIHAIRQDTGMVFQQFNLYPHKTVIENVMEALIVVKKQSKEQAKAIASKVLKQVGLQEKENVYPSKLSGGQQQRVAIARALAMEPKIMLFDEPTSALDPELVGEVLKVMKELADEGMTMVIVTHEMRFAQDAADRILFMADGQIVEDAEPKKFFLHPSKERAQKFLAKVNEF